ncbi:MAG: ACT domain-containing protein [Anaerolineae bacterium]
MTTQENLEAGGLLYKNHLAMVGLMGIPSRPGVGGQFFSAVAEAGIHVELIVNIYDWKGRDHIMLCVNREALESTLEIARDVQEATEAEALIQDPDVALVCIFSADFEDSQKIAGHMFKTLGDHDINIQGISTSVSTISCMIAADDLTRAVDALRQAFVLP